MGELETFHVSAAMQCSMYYHIYLIKRRPRSRAAYASKITNKPPPSPSKKNERHMGTFKVHNIKKQFTITVASDFKK